MVRILGLEKDILKTTEAPDALSDAILRTARPLSVSGRADPDDGPRGDRWLSELKRKASLLCALETLLECQIVIERSDYLSIDSAQIPPAELRLDKAAQHIADKCADLLNCGTRGEALLAVYAFAKIENHCWSDPEFDHITVRNLCVMTNRKVADEDKMCVVRGHLPVP